MAGAGKRKRVTSRKRKEDYGAFIAVVGRTVVAGRIGLRVTDPDILSEALHYIARGDRVAQAKVAFVSTDGPHFMRMMGGPYGYDPD
jgi:hypothetical protein